MRIYRGKLKSDDGGDAEKSPTSAAKPIAPGADGASQTGGQEDLKALLDESINNLVRANNAVEVLLKATNQNPAKLFTQQQPAPAAAAAPATGRK